MTNAEPFLILHKVRGEPAYDIAIKLDGMEDGDPIWIIPTSGHRAYPFWSYKLDNLMADAIPVAHWHNEPLPDSWPDHYAINSTKAKIEPSFLRKLISKAQTVTGTRRV